MQLTVPAGDSRVRQLACFNYFWEMIASKVHSGCGTKSLNRKFPKENIAWKLLLDISCISAELCLGFGSNLNIHIVLWFVCLILHVNLKEITGPVHSSTFECSFNKHDL